MIGPEPTLDSKETAAGEKAEARLQRALIGEIRRFIGDSNRSWAIIESFGLDVAAFCGDHGFPQAKFLELKAYVGNRAGGVGFQGRQVDLLWNTEANRSRSAEELKVFDSSVRWVLAHGLKPLGSPRYAIFTCLDAQNAAMGGVRPNKQNNLKISAFDNSLVTWEVLNTRIRSFLFG